MKALAALALAVGCAGAPSGDDLVAITRADLVLTICITACIRHTLSPTLLFSPRHVVG